MERPSFPTRQGPEAAAAAGSRGLRMVIPYTTRELTRRAMEEAAKLADDLRAEITVVAVQVVPFPSPLSRPAVDPAHLESELLALAETSAHCTRILMVRARDRDVGFRKALGPGSLVLLATKRQWWRTAEERLARSLARAGHNVALVPV